MTGVDAGKDYEALARFSRRDAEAYGEWRKWLGGLAAILEPLLLTPPKIGSRPLDLLDQLKLAWRMRGLDVPRVGGLSRLMTMSAWDLLDDWFEVAAGKGRDVGRRHYRDVGRSCDPWDGVRPDAPRDQGTPASASAPGDIPGEAWGPSPTP